MFRRHPYLSAATIAYLGAVGFLTLNPSINADDSSWTWRFYEVLQGWPATHWISFGMLDFGTNILLFIPAGLFFVLLFGRRSWWVAIVFGILGSCWVELAQYLWLPERTSDSRDIVSNSIGVALGVALAMLASKNDANRDAPARARATAPARAIDI